MKFVKGEIRGKLKKINKERGTWRKNMMLTILAILQVFSRQNSMMVDLIMYAAVNPTLEEPWPVFKIASGDMFIATIRVVLNAPRFEASSI